MWDLCSSVFWNVCVPWICLQSPLDVPVLQSICILMKASPVFMTWNGLPYHLSTPWPLSRPDFMDLSLHWPWLFLLLPLASLLNLLFLPIPSLCASLTICFWWDLIYFSTLQHAKISASPKCVLPVWRKPPSECSTSVNAWKNDSPTQNISQSTYKRERFRLKVCGVSLNLNQLDWACDLKEVKSLCDVPSTGRSSVPCWGAGSKCCVFQIGSNKHFSLSVWSVFLLFDLDC